MSPATAKTHVSRAMIKLHARDRAQLVVIAYETGLVRPGWSGCLPPSGVPEHALLRPLRQRRWLGCRATRWRPDLVTDERVRREPLEGDTMLTSPAPCCLQPTTGTAPAPGGRSSRSCGCSFIAFARGDVRPLLAAQLATAARTPGETRLAERFAAGEIDEAGVPRAPRRAARRTPSEAADDVPRSSSRSRGLTKRYGDGRWPSTGSASPSTAVRSTASSARTGPARPPRCACCSA